MSGFTSEMKRQRNETTSSTFAQGYGGQASKASWNWWRCPDFIALRRGKGKNLEGVLILRNSSRKLKTVADNAILLNYAVSSENISERIKIQTENGFHLKRNVCKFR